MGQGSVTQQQAITPSCLSNVVNVKTKFLHQVWGPICTDLMIEMMISLGFYQQSQIQSSSLKKKKNQHTASDVFVHSTQQNDKYLSLFLFFLLNSQWHLYLILFF